MTIFPPPSRRARRLWSAAPGEPDDPIELRIDDTGESWIGAGRPIGDRTKTTVRVGFTIADEPYSIELPASPILNS